MEMALYVGDPTNIFVRLLASHKFSSSSVFLGIEVVANSSFQSSFQLASLNAKLSAKFPDPESSPTFAHDFVPGQRTRAARRGKSFCDGSDGCAEKARSVPDLRPGDSLLGRLLFLS